jgi:hypothetical protein
MYIVTSKPGMTPWSYSKTGREALEDQRAARMQGLDGDIYPDNVDICPECNGDPLLCECLSPLSEPPLTLDD